jgi:hypothetical protein
MCLTVLKAKIGPRGATALLGVRAGGATELHQRQCFRTDGAEAVLREANATIQRDGRDICCRSAHGKHVPIAQAKQLKHERPRDAISLVVRMHDERSDENLTGFIVRRDAEGSHDRSVLKRSEIALLARLNVFGCSTQGREVIDLEKAGLLCVGQRMDRADLLGHGKVVMIERNDAHHAFAPATIGAAKARRLRTR